MTHFCCCARMLWFLPDTNFFLFFFYRLRDVSRTCSAYMASPIKLAHALKTVREEAPQTCLAAEEMGEGILVPSRMYIYMNKSDGKMYVHTYCHA